MVDNFTEQQIAEFKKAFSPFDTHGNGAITEDELGKVLKSLGYHHLTKAEIFDLMVEVDPDGNGTTDFAKLVSILTKINGTEEELLENFKKFDLDGNGLISITELRIGINN